MIAFVDTDDDINADVMDCAADGMGIRPAMLINVSRIESYRHSFRKDGKYYWQMPEE